MRHSASLLASLEGMSHAAFLIARELTQNSRTGLTPRFLARKLDMPIEEVEYLVDVNHRLLYTDLTRIRLVPEGYQTVKRIQTGLESHGDAAALKQYVRALSDIDLQVLEDRLGLEADLPKKDIAEQALARIYKHPDSVLHYVAGSDFSARARELFDALWQSREGILSISQMFSMNKRSEFEVEQALTELFQGCACFELFRFDHEQRLIRAAVLLKEVRDFLRHTQGTISGTAVRLRPVREEIESARLAGLVFSETTCRLTAAIAAHPVRLRNDGEMFREDRRRLEHIRLDEDEPSLNTCIWAAEGLRWIARVDNTLRAGDVDALVDLHPLQRHRLLYEWLTSQSDVAPVRGILEKMLEELEPDAWYPVMEFIGYARKLSEETDAPLLKQAGTHYEYLSPGAGNRLEMRIARVLEESFFWIGVVARGYAGDESCFQITPLGRAMLAGELSEEILEQYPHRTGGIVVQPNYEIAASLEELDPLLTVPLDIFAVRASDSPITIYKLSRESFVRAMQQGHPPEPFISFLLRHNRGPLPENVLITLKDWCGTAKQVRLRTYHVLEADDPLVIAELEHQKHWRKYVAVVDPQKVIRYQGISRAELKNALEKEGFIVSQ
jgi:hypothetical protein